MKRVLLFYPLPKFGGPIQPRIELPQGLLAVAGPLDQSGYSVRIIDQRLESGWRDILIDELTKNTPVCVGLSVMTGPQIKHALDVSQFIKEHGKVPVVWGGIHPTLMPKQTLDNKYIDIIVQGEGEDTLLNLVRALETKTTIDTVNGIFYKKDNAIVQTAPSPLVDLDKQQPLPYHLVDFSKYLVNINGQPHVSLETSRGCPFKCAYCYDTAVYKSRWRGLSAENTINRIKSIIADYGVNAFLFTDDNFFGSKQRAIDIFKRLKKEVPGITCSKVDGHVSMLDSLSNDELRLLKDAGCTRIMMGIESGASRVLKILKKELEIQTLLKFNKRLIDYDIIPHYFFMMGCPTETEDELAQTVDLFLKVARENQAAIPRLNVFTPFPGTGLYDLSVQNGLRAPEKLGDWIAFNFRTVNDTASWLSEKRRKIIRMLHFMSALAIKGNFIIPYKKTDLIVRILAALYYPVARFRVKNLFYRFPIELKLAEWIGVYPKQR